ncbi:hypothetical protein ERICV_05095 [Paenibacillus phage phiERICV]|uniref:Uncharacterized protein n=1 Tax=Paenibacillus larvae subsp. larvae TaxID=147375 RepID=A0A6C0QZF6_9BACL|nr:GTPase-activating protein [Paenibacillus larvae]QHZ49994.1 hypothetical protein ERICV_00817 [Paenibacillus larvae subsp. larvae]QHZ54079.1 hypothetical protein ERICV_05095 [Paenibacillus phage phiERICV]
MSDTDQKFYEVAKEITIAAIENGLIVPLGNETMSSAEINQQNAQAIADFYKTVAKTVSAVVVCDFESIS